MATAKLWWNGSTWSSSEAFWLNGNTKGSLTCWVVYSAQIIAYDDATLRFKGTMRPNGSGASYELSGTKTYKSEGDTLTTFNNANRSRDVALTIGSYPATLTYSGNVSVIRYEGTPQYGNPWQGSGSTSITNPFVTVTFNANGGTGGPSTQTVCKGAACALTSSKPTRSGYTFSKWNTKADGTGTSYASGANINVSANTTLYAIWSTNEYPVSITADEGVTITFDGEDFSDVTTTVNKPFGKVCAYTIKANSGFIIKTRSPATDGSMTIKTSANPSLSAVSQRVGCHLDDGDNWVQACIYYDDGAQWHMVQAYVDNGVSWELVY